MGIEAIIELCEVVSLIEAVAKVVDRREIKAKMFEKAQCTWGT